MAGKEEVAQQLADARAEILLLRRSLEVPPFRHPSYMTPSLLHDSISPT